MICRHLLQIELGAVFPLCDYRTKASNHQNLSCLGQSQEHVLTRMWTGNPYQPLSHCICLRTLMDRTAIDRPLQPGTTGAGLDASSHAGSGGLG